MSGTIKELMAGFDLFRPGKNKGHVTEQMREKWRSQFNYLSSNECIWNKINQKEEKFLMNIGNNYLSKNKDLSFHQSKYLNDIFNKYQ